MVEAVHETAVQRVSERLERAVGDEAYIVEQAVLVVENTEYPPHRVPALALLAKRIQAFSDKVDARVVGIVKVERATRSLT